MAAAPPAPRLLALLLAACCCCAPASGASAATDRVALELETELTVKRGAGEPPFAVGKRYSCVLGRAGQFSLHIPPQDYHDTGVHASGAGRAKDADTLVCSLPRVVTAGNSTVCIVPANSSGGAQLRFPAFQPLEEGAVDATAQKQLSCPPSPYAPVFVTHFPLFAPAWDRRPYFREEEGALIAELDLLSLAGKTVTLAAGLNASHGAATPLLSKTMEVAGAESPLARRSCDAHGRCVPVLPVRVPFPTARIPSPFDQDVVISLTVHGGDRAEHTRRLQRAAPPPDGSAVATFQVGHESQALLRDGVTFVMSGWFAGGYGHESAGLPPAYFLRDEITESEALSALGQASLTTQWGRDGVTFVRAGAWADPALAKVYLEAAGAAGVSVLWNVGAVSRAMIAIYRIWVSHSSN